MMEDRGLVWVSDKDGNWFVANLEDLVNPNNLSEKEKERCLMLDLKDLKRLAYNRSLFPQILHKPSMGHSRWKLWLTPLFLLMVNLLIWLMVHFNQTA